MDKWRSYFGFPQMQGTYGFLFVLVIDAFGSGLFLPLSILYFRVTAGFALSSIGLTLTIATICTLPITFITGSFVDRFGTRRMTAISQFTQAIGLLGYLFVHTIPILFLMALLVTGGARMFYAASTVLVAEIASPNERDRWYGLVGVIRNVGLGLGGFLAGLVLATNDIGVYHVVVGSSFVCYLVAGNVLLHLSNIGQKHVELVKDVHYGAVMRDHVFLGFLISTFSFPLCALMLGIALPIYVTQAVHAPAWVVSSTLILSSLLMISCQTLIVRLIESYRRTRVIGVAAFVWSGACGLFALALAIPRLFLVPYLFLVVILYTLASLLYTPTASALVAEFGPTALRGRYLATYEFSWGAANALTPALFTVLYTVTPNLPWLVLAILTFISGVSMFWVERLFIKRDQ